MIGASMAVRAPRTRGLGQMAMDAIRRNAGTLLLPGAATPVLGPELCTDGGFNVGVADWTAAGGVHTWTGSALRRAIGQGNAGSYRDFAVTPNAEYLVGGAILNAVGSGGLVINIYGGGGFTGLLASLPATGYAFVRPTTSTLRIYFYTDNTRGADLDDVTVRLFSGYTHGNPALRNYLDSAGTDILDSVTQVDQPVGLCLDSMGVLGAELVLSSTRFSAAFNCTLTNGGELPFTQTATANANYSAYTGGVLQVGKMYRITASWTGNTSNRWLYLDALAGTPLSNAVSGTVTTEYRCGIASLSLGVLAGLVGESITVTALSVKEIPGNHCSQPTTASKPILRRGLVNQLTQSDFQAGVVDAPSRGGLVTASTLAGYGGALAFGKDGSTGTWAYKSFAHTSGATYTVCAVVEMTDGLAPSWGAGSPSGSASPFAIVGNGQTPAASSEYVVTSLGGTLYLVSWSYVAGGDTRNTGISTYAANNNRTFKVTRYGLFTGTVTASQILAAGGIPLTTTAAASSARGNHAWQFDGSNDSLALGAVPFQMSDDHFVVAGAALSAGAGENVVFSIRNSGAGLGNPIIAQIDAPSGTPRGVWRDDAGTIALLNGSGSIYGVKAVMSVVKQGNVKRLRVNGAQAATNSTALGATTVTSCTVGVTPTATPASYVNGNLSCVVIGRGTVSDADLALIERFVASLQGQTL